MEPKRRQHQINSGFIRVVTDTNTQIPAFWAHPTIGGPFPGLILLHDDWGLGAATRTVAQRFAEGGYYVIVPDMFEGNRANSQIEADGLELRYKPFAAEKVAASFPALETHPKCNAKMAVVGWDLGGELGIQLGLERPDIMAAVAFSADPSAFLDKVSQLRCPVMAFFGEKDPLTEQYADLFEKELQAHDKRHQVVIYPMAEHAFYNHLTPAYHPDAAEDSWVKLLEFLETYQGKPPAPDDAAPGYFRPGRVY